MLSSNHSGSPAVHRSNAPSPRRSPRYTPLRPPRGPFEVETSTASPQTVTPRMYGAARPSPRIDHVAPRSVLVASPPAHAARTSPSAVATWCTSASMSIVGVHDAPPSLVRRIPPTCTFT